MTLQWTNICSLHIDEHWKFVKLKFIPHKQQHQKEDQISDLLLIYLHAEKEEIVKLSIVMTRMSP
uniref:Uncharacterized protein n=1 Tax=Glossina palpalis gambiensis TaxID=67801 RepID=A0A1B0BWA0_9MUSC